MISKFLRNLKLQKKRHKRGIKNKQSFIITNRLDTLSGYKKHLKHKLNRISTLASPTLYNVEKTYPTLKDKVVDLEIALLEKMQIFARSHSVADKNNLFNLYLFKSKTIHKLKNTYTEALNKENQVDIYYSYKEELTDNFLYIHLLHEHSNNYFHWITEVLPRALEVDELLKTSKEFTTYKKKVLVDAKLHPNLYTLLSACLNFEYEFIYVEEYSSLEVPKLLYVVPLWISLDNVTQAFDAREEFFIDRYAIEQVSKRFLLPHAKRAKRKVYLQRPSTHARALLNEIELLACLEAYGFEIIRTDMMSLDEQIELFRETKLVLGVSGAAFSNILFMQPNTQAIILSPSVEGSNYYVFEQLATVANVSIIHLLTHSPAIESVHSEAVIDLELLEKILEIYKDKK